LTERVVQTHRWRRRCVWGEHGPLADLIRRFALAGGPADREIPGVETSPDAQSAVDEHLRLDSVRTLFPEYAPYRPAVALEGPQPFDCLLVVRHAMMPPPVSNRRRGCRRSEAYRIFTNLASPRRHCVSGASANGTTPWLHTWTSSVDSRQLTVDRHPDLPRNRETFSGLTPSSRSFA
jgi:hypothetical protein